MTPPYELADYIELRERQGRDQARENQRELKQMAQAGPAAEQLTGDPKWDLFLQILKERDDRDREMLKQVEAGILASGTVGLETLMSLKITRAELLGGMQARAEVLDIPKQLVTDAGKALELLKLTDTG